jgi:hypothetical protein
MHHVSLVQLCSGGYYFWCSSHLCISNPLKRSVKQQVSHIATATIGDGGGGEDDVNDAFIVAAVPYLWRTSLDLSRTYVLPIGRKNRAATLDKRLHHCTSLFLGAA